MTQAVDGKLCRIRLAQGRITRPQLRRLTLLAESYGNGVIELTNRANIQLRGIRPESVRQIIDALESAELAPKTPAGDGVRNVMINPTAGFDIKGDGRILPLAQQLSALLQRDPRYQTLSPKFSILLDGGEACAVIHHVSDIWLSVCDAGKKFAFGLASRPPLEGEANAALGKIPFKAASDLVSALVEILLDVRDQRPEIERMKHLLAEYDITHRLQQKLPFLEKAENFCRFTPRPHAHIGTQPMNIAARFYLGVKPPLGRLTPAMARFIADMSDNDQLRLTPWQSIILPDLDLASAERQQQVFAAHGFVTRASQALARIICCIGATGCQRAHSLTHDDAMVLAGLLQNHSFADVHLSGCAKSCAANEALATSLVAQGEGIYDLFRQDKNAVSPFGQLIASTLSIEQAAEKIAQISTHNPA